MPGLRGGHHRPEPGRENESNPAPRPRRPTRGAADRPIRGPRRLPASGPRGPRIPGPAPAPVASRRSRRPAAAARTRETPAIGLTLHYSYRLPHADPDRARRFLAALRESATGLGFGNVSRLYEIDPPEGRPAPGFEHVTEPEGVATFRFLAGTWQPHPPGDGGDEEGNDAGDRRLVELPSVGHLLHFCVRDEGAETAGFGLTRYPAHLDCDASGVPIDHPTGLGGVYAWHAFCKTQYAGLPKHGGPDHFLAAHHRLVLLLDEAQRLGAELEVMDEAGDWEHRDPEQLRAVLQKHNRLIAAFTGGLRDALEDAGEGRDAVQAPILDHPGFEHLEAEGLKELQGREDLDGDRLKFED